MLRSIASTTSSARSTASTGARVSVVFMVCGIPYAKCQMECENAMMFAEISAIPVTPFDDGGAVDEAALQATVARIVGSGIELGGACGHTSEYSSLTSAESERVAALTIEAGGSAKV